MIKQGVFMKRCLRAVGCFRAIKSWLLVLLFAGFSIAAYGKDFSLNAGAGAFAGYTFTRYTLTADGGKGNPNGKLRLDQKMDRFNWGGFLFFDATYVEFNLSYQGGLNRYNEKMKSQAPGADWTEVKDNTGQGIGQEAFIGLTLLGKYPFHINEQFTWFPLLGVEYRFALLEQRSPDGSHRLYNRQDGDLPADLNEDGDSYPLSAWNECMIDMGAGFDLNIQGPWFLRSELLFGFRLPTGYELGSKKMLKTNSNGNSQNIGFNASGIKNWGLTGGPTLRLSVGYRIKSWG
jgi:hypothetical protein